MEDKRIAKTKQNLRSALVELAGEKAFEQVTVTELCKRAGTSRITFYAHYSDKFELLDEVFQDMRQRASGLFYKRQHENNSAGDLTESYCNLMDSILDVYYGQEPFFSHAVPHESHYLYYYLHNYIVDNVVNYLKRGYSRMKDEKGLKRVTAFVCSGLWAVLQHGQQEGKTLEEIRGELKKMLRALMESGALLKMV